MLKKIKDWEELVYATKKLLKDDSGYTKKIKMSFSNSNSSGEKAISMFIDDKDFLNRYFSNPNDEKDDSYCCWEIFLYPDGSWRIK